MEELHEADVLWPAENLDTQHDEGGGGGGGVDGAIPCYAPSVVPCGDVSAAAAAAVVAAEQPSSVRCVPRPRKRRSRSWSCATASDLTGGGGGDGEDGFVPPHVLAERRRRVFAARTAAYSMCSGKGRTLKGRDLRNVRNLVLQMTGFIER